MINSIRKSRVTRKYIPKTVKLKVQKDIDLVELLGVMSPEQIIDMLEGIS